MIGFQLDERLDRGAAVGSRLRRQPQHQIEADVSAPRRPSQHDGLPGLRRRVSPSQPAQLGIVERLYAEAHPVDTGCEPSGETRRCHRLRVRLERDLGPWIDVEDALADRDQTRDFFGSKQRRRAASEVDRVDRGAVTSPVDLGLERIDIAPLQPRLDQAAVEVAVVADRFAERNVEIQPELVVIWHRSLTAPTLQEDRFQLLAFPPDQPRSSWPSFNWARARTDVRRGSVRRRGCDFQRRNRSSSPGGYSKSR